MNAADVVDSILATRKYRHLCRATVNRVVAWAIPRSRTTDDAEKRARRKLHQIFGAYAAGLDEARLSRRLANLEDTELSTFAREVMKAHASTRERMVLTDRVFDALFEVTGPPTGLLDLGAGLNVFALPWERLDPAISYRGYEIDRRCVDLGNSFLKRMGREPGLEHRDVLDDPPGSTNDVILLLKMLPCLEQQFEGASRSIMTQLQAPAITISFPTKTLGGRTKGLGESYACQFEALLGELGRSWTRLAMSGELFYVVRPR